VAHSRGLSVVTVVVLALIFGLIGGGIGAYVVMNSVPSETAPGPQPLPAQPQPVRVISEDDALHARG